MSLRLGLHYHVPAIRKENRIFMPGYQAVFIDSLAVHCDKIVCFLHSPREDEAYLCTNPIKSSNVELVNIGKHESVPNRILKSGRYSSHVVKYANELDVFLLRGPSPLLPAMARRLSDIPIVLLLVASYKDGLASLSQPGWRKFLIGLWAKWNEDQQLKIARRSLTFVNSARLYQQLKPAVPNLIETKTSTITKQDFYYREDTCTTPPYHILFSGRITPEKGVFDILDALAILRQRGVDFIFDLVGMPENEQFMDEFWKGCESRNICEFVMYHGFKSVGNELFSSYRQADVLIIASISSEGFPRTIWEAFSQSTPVVATEVGSIPFFLKHEKDALLAPPNQPEELAKCLIRIFTEGELRRRLIENGRKLAVDNTLDVRGKEMIDAIEDWLATRSTG